MKVLKYKAKTPKKKYSGHQGADDLRFTIWPPEQIDGKSLEWYSDDTAPTQRRQP